MGWSETIGARYAKVVSEISAALPKGRSAKISNRPEERVQWVIFQRDDQPAMAPAGWKVHLSVHPKETETFLGLIESFLLPSCVPFKIPFGLDDFLAMNGIDTTPSQLGKIVTMYPSNPKELSHLISLLSAEWPLRRGPKIASDLYKASGDTFSLRYGQYGEARTRVDACGRQSVEIQMPDGSWGADRRSEFGAQPWGATSVTICGTNWSALPLIAPGEVELHGEKYDVVRRMGPWFKQTLLLAMPENQHFGATRVHRGACAFNNGLTAEEYLVRQYEILLKLYHKGGLSGPKPIIIEEPLFVWLVRGWVEGSDLTSIKARSNDLPLKKIFAKVRSLHELGIVHRDLKPTNILLNHQTGDINLIDYEFAASISEVSTPHGGTVGYRPPEYRDDGAVAVPAYDVYSLAALAVQSITGCSPSFHVFNPTAVGEALTANGHGDSIEFFACALSADASKRPSLEAFENYMTGIQLRGAMHGPWTDAMTKEAQRAIALACASTRNFRAETHDGFTWWSKHPISSPKDLSINSGTAGVVLGLLLVKELTGATNFDKDIEGGLNHLAEATLAPEVPGMFTGSAGVALTLARGSRVLRNDLFKARALEIVEFISTQNPDPDLFFGSAGIVAAATCIADEIVEDKPLAHVENAALKLLSAAREHDKMVCWIPSGILDESRIPKTSVSHGAAGIAYALGRWGTRFKRNEAALQIEGDVLYQMFVHGRTPDGLSLRAEVMGDLSDTPNTIWCRGLSGYLWALVRCKRNLPNQEWIKDALAWGESILLGEKINGNATMCHGLAGQLDLCLDLLSMGSGQYQPDLERRAQNVARLLLASRVEHEGSMTWPSENAAWLSPSFWVGMTGSAYAMARWVAYCHKDQRWRNLLF